MFRIRIEFDGVLTNSAEFETRDLCMEFYNNLRNRLPSGHAYSIQDISEELKIRKESEEAIEFLKNTDYLVIRKSETGQDYPEEIKIARAEARLKVVK